MARKKNTDVSKVEEASKVDIPHQTSTEEAVNVEQVEAPKVEAPKVEAPKVEAPKVEAPKVEAELDQQKLIAERRRRRVLGF